MYNGDRRRKTVLVDNGFRLPSALDNRPLNFQEFELLRPQVIYMSATPGEYELQKTEGLVAEQIVRPTGLLDPEIEVRPTKFQVDDLIKEIHICVEKKERILVTTLTKRMSEDLCHFLIERGIRTRYIHSEIHTLERIEILRDLRLGEFDVLIGINLLREGLDLPEVSLVAILDADKEGFLRSATALTQISGRAARHINGKVIMYADRITGSMQSTIDETMRRRKKQMAFNKEHSIIPAGVLKSKEEIMGQTSVLEIKKYNKEQAYNELSENSAEFLDIEALEKRHMSVKKLMKEAAKELEFIEAARLRDEMYDLEKRIKQKKGA
jgi:excinuclease ABC subunit B